MPVERTEPTVPAEKSEGSEGKGKLTKEQKTFITKVILFVLFGALLPLAFVMWRYGCFTDGGFTMAGWGWIAAMVIFFFMLYVMNQLRKTLPWSYFSQIVTGMMKVILPLTLVYVLVWNLQDSIDYFLQSLAAIIVCECVAICVNPFPKWRHDHKIEERDGTIKAFSKEFIRTWKEENK